MTQSLLCETVTGDTMAELMAAREGDADPAVRPDLVELRLDGVRDLDIAQALQGRRGPVIVTCRPTWEGGRFAGTEDERRNVLRQAISLGAEYVDVEWRAGFADLIAQAPSRIVISSHDFAGVPDDLCARAQAMRATGAATIKVAVCPARLSDTLPLRDIAAGGNAVVIGMGAPGVPTRLLASRFGSTWTYGGPGIAPGQIPPARMVRDYRFRDVGPRTAIYGLVGHDAIESPLPAAHNAWFAAQGIDAVCVPLPAADFSDFLTFADALGLAGASMAAPFEEDVLAGDTLRRGPGGWDAMHSAGDAERQLEFWTT
jgi:3-dehydroquinate dehydratase/shikimate dehydrogenase